MARAKRVRRKTRLAKRKIRRISKKEFAQVTGNELAALMPIYDKIAPVQQQNSFNFNSLAM
mgnify:CR=1 FL=1